MPNPFARANAPIAAQLRTSADADERLSPATQIAPNSEDYLGGSDSQLGRKVSEHETELFVEGQAVEALRRHFEASRPEFIALHDLGSNAAQRLLNALATSTGRKLQRLVVRRQGLGVPLATLQFVELPLSRGRLLRIFSTSADADTHAREQITATLLSYSRLGVLLVGDVPNHVLDASMLPLRTAMAAGKWPNRELLAVPMALCPALAAQATTLQRLCGANVRVTPQVNRPTEAWAFISGAWNRQQELLNATRTDRPQRRVSDQYEPTQPMALAPMPGEPEFRAVPQATDSASARLEPLQHYVSQVAALRGVASCCVFDQRSQRSLAFAGIRPGGTALAVQGASMVRAMSETSLVFGFGSHFPDAVVSLGDKHLLLRPVPHYPGAMLHAVVERDGLQLPNLKAELARLDQALPSPGRRG